MHRTDAGRVDVAAAADRPKAISGLATAWLPLEIRGAVPNLTLALTEARPTLIAVAIVVSITVRLADRI